MPELCARERLKRSNVIRSKRDKFHLTLGISRQRLYELMSIHKPYKPKPPTKRQIEVLQLIAEGKASGEIAKVLNLSIKTIQKHRALIYKKLKAHNVAQVIMAGIRGNWIKV